MLRRTQDSDQDVKVRDTSFSPVEGGTSYRLEDPTRVHDTQEAVSPSWVYSSKDEKVFHERGCRKGPSQGRG